MTDDAVTRLQKKLAPKRVEVDGEPYWVAEGDLLLDSAQLAEYAHQREIERAQQKLREEAEQLGVGQPATPPLAALVGILVGGKIVRWRDGAVLSYTILRNTFADEREYRVVRQAIAEARRDWEEACGVRFRHRASLDDSPTTAVSGVKFTIRKIDAGGRFIAAAFFPTDPPDRRRVLIDPSFFSPNLSFDRVGVLRHELGHVLGFRHEHIRSEAPPNCPDEDIAETINLSDYDPGSVMHYFCGSVGSRELSISETDRLAAQRVYGLSLREYTFVD